MQDNKPMPLYDMRASSGESYLDKDGKCLESYKYSYTPRHDLINGDQPPLDIGFAVGINVYACNTEFSSLNRNQVFLWVQDPSLKSKMRGLVLLLSNIVYDIRRCSTIDVLEKLKINLETGQTITRETVMGKDETDSSLSLSAVSVSQKKHKVKPERNKKPLAIRRARTRAQHLISKIKPPSPQITLAVHESVSRGWDATNNQWRNAIYPQLDKHFRVIDRAAESHLVAYKVCSH
ncbi:hypothetical protein FB451DRAFT_204831 [Mycena latifolia]|nr:hypothetical protein FB451DRAFT_204831 [Mycena latifolia]